MEVFSLTKESYLKLSPQMMLGSIFIFSSIAKIFSSNSILINVESTFGIQSESLSLILTILIIVVEMILGFGLLLNIKAGLNVILAGLLLITFLFYNSYQIINGDSTDCGCFGSFIPTDNKQMILIDLILLALVLISIKFRETINNN